eukprot:4497956-Pyramimonas_sp.AAC.1
MAKVFSWKQLCPDEWVLGLARFLREYSETLLRALDRDYSQMLEDNAHLINVSIDGRISGRVAVRQEAIIAGRQAPPTNAIFPSAHFT